MAYIYSTSLREGFMIDISFLLHCKNSLVLSTNQLVTSTNSPIAGTFLGI